jgi:N-acetylmuramoyl-L-alanine amidase
MGNNHLSGVNISSTDTSTVIDLSVKWKSAFNITFNPINFKAVGDKLYYLENFNPNTVTITFDYTTVVPKIPKELFKDNKLFTSSRWERSLVGGVPKVMLKLTLKKSGVYYGCDASYSSDGKLSFRFNNPGDGFKGMKFVLDPGHGKGDTGAIGSYTMDGEKIIVNERDLNWTMANLLKDRLVAQGATVEMIDSKSTQYSLAQRVAFAQKRDPAIYIAVHHNSSSSSNSTGVETYYNTPFSKPLAHSINNRLGQYYNQTFYTDGKNRNRGDHFSEFYVTRVHDFASILVEYGFVNNPTELKKLCTSNYQKGLADATIQGLKDYLDLAR